MVEKVVANQQNYLIKLANHSYLLLLIQLFLNLLQTNKEIEVGNQLLEQPIFNVINKLNE